jgi:hypothetical protein
LIDFFSISNTYFIFFFFIDRLKHITNVYNPLHWLERSVLQKTQHPFTVYDRNEVYENGNLYLDHCNGILSWRDMIDMLWGIAGGLERIHSE